MQFSYPRTRWIHQIMMCHWWLVHQCPRPGCMTALAQSFLAVPVLSPSQAGEIPTSRDTTGPPDADRDVGIRQCCKGSQDLPTIRNPAPSLLRPPPDSDRDGSGAEIPTCRDATGGPPAAGKLVHQCSPPRLLASVFVALAACPPVINVGADGVRPCRGPARRARRTRISRSMLGGRSIGG